MKKAVRLDLARRLALGATGAAVFPRALLMLSRASFSRASFAGAVLRTALLTGALLTLIASPAAAQLPVQRATPLPSPGRSVAATDDTTAIVENPANVGFLPAAELRWIAHYLDERAAVPDQGHAFALGFPIPFIPLATGIRADFVDPPRTASFEMFGESANYQWLTWALALRPNDRTSLGFSLQRSYSDSPLAHDFSSWSFGLSSRPFNGLGLAFVGHDINSPVSDGGVRLGASYDIAAAIRPLGTRELEVGLEGKYVDERDGYWIPRATLGVDILPIGRIRGDFAVSDPGDDAARAWVATASVVLYGNGAAGSMELAGGSSFGDGLGGAAQGEALANLHTEVAFKGWREPAGSDGPAYAIRIRIEDTPSVREHVALLRKLWAIADSEPSVKAVAFELRTSPASSFAHVEELRDAIAYLRANGKQVLCHFEDNNGSALYMCASANRILINPGGGLRFAGLKTRYFYFAELMSKLGIRADFVRIGEHKSAPETFTRMGPTDQSRRDKVDLLQQFELEFITGVSLGRNVPVNTLRERIATGPFIAPEARAAGLVDGYAFDDQLEEEVQKLVGMEVPLIEDQRATRAPNKFRASQKVAIVYVDGDMIDGRSQQVPFLGIKTAGSYTIAEAIKQVREDPMVGAMVLRIETGGGSAMAADVIWREVQLTAAKKPVVVSMGSAAASGGYYIASPATYIFANPLSITGSIGIFYGKADVAQLLRKIGVNVQTYLTHERADAESIFRPFSPEERRELERKVEQFYQMFLQRVATGRKMSKEAVDDVGRGRVWTGRQAKHRGLVDELGSLRQALAQARQLAGLPNDSPILELPEVQTTILGRILGIEGIHEQAKLPLPGQLHDMVTALSPFVIHSGEKPLARAELVVIQP